MGVFPGALRGYGFSDIVAAPASLRAIVHGFAVIEASGGFGPWPDSDETYESLIRKALLDLRRSRRCVESRKE